MDNYDKEEKQLFTMLTRFGMTEEQAKQAMPRIMTWIDLLVRIRGREIK